MSRAIRGNYVRTGGRIAPNYWETVAPRTACRCGAAVEAGRTQCTECAEAAVEELRANSQRWLAEDAAAESAAKLAQVEKILSATQNTGNGGRRLNPIHFLDAQTVRRI